MHRSSLPVCLTIAGSDSSGGAGIQADLKTFQAFGCFGTSVVTAVTAQNTLGVRDLEGVRADLVVAQLEAVLEDLPVAAAKTGMLFAREIIESVHGTWVAARARAGRLIPLVIDPVMIATSGDHLLRPEAEQSLKAFLSLGTVVTPNLPEAAVLLGIDSRDIASLEDMENTVRRLQGSFGSAFLLKGGHRSQQESEAVDVLCAEGKLYHFRGALLDARHTHGTGCTLSAAIAAGLAHDPDLVRAVAAAKEYVSGAILHAPGLGQGNGPLNHMWREP